METCSADEKQNLIMEHHSIILEIDSVDLERGTLAILQSDSKNLQSNSMILESIPLTLQPSSVTLEPSSVTLEQCSATVELNPVNVEPNSVTSETNCVTLKPHSETSEPNLVISELNSTNYEGGSASCKRDTTAVNSKKRTFRQYCSAINCNINTMNSPDISFFRFPKDKERCQKWLVNGRREDLFKKSPEALYHGYRLCAKHFEDCMFSNDIKTRLFMDAVPTLFDVPNPPQQITLKRKLPNRREHISKKRTITNDLPSAVETVEIPVAEELRPQLPVTVPMTTMIVVAVDNNSTYVPSQPVSTEAGNSVLFINENGSSCTNDCACIECQPDGYKAVGTQTDPFVCTKEEKKRVAIKMKSLQRKIRRLETKLQHANERLETEHAISSEKAMEKLKTELPEEAFYLLQSMMKVSKERYSEEEKNFFLSFYFQARAGYQYLRDRQIHMPHPKTVQKWKREMCSGPESAVESLDWEEHNVGENIMLEEVEQLVVQQSDDAELAYSIAIIANVDLENSQGENVHYCLI